MKLQTVYKERTMELNIGKELNQEKFEELVAGTCLESLTLNEIVDIAFNDELMNPGKNKFWKFAGTYYRFNLNNLPIIVIDREQTVGGYNNSELELTLIDDNTIKSNHKTFENLVYLKLEEKEHNQTL